MKEIKAYVHRDSHRRRDRGAQGLPRLGRRARRAAATTWPCTSSGGRWCRWTATSSHYAMDLGDEVVDEYKLELLCEDGEVDALVTALIRRRAHRAGRSPAG